MSGEGGKEEVSGGKKNPKQPSYEDVQFTGTYTKWMICPNGGSSSIRMHHKFSLVEVVFS